MYKNFYVPIEIKNRDFYGRLLLSLEVCKKLGWNVYFGFRGDVNFFARKYSPGVYYGLATIRNFENLYSDIKKNGNLISISDEEGLVTYSEKYYKSFKISKKNLESADAIFTWGEKNKEILKMFTSENKIFSYGNPRLDLLKKPYSSIYDREIKEIKKKYGTFYLICTNFSYINYYEKNVKYSEILKKRDFFTNENDLTEWYKYEKIKKKIFNELSLFLAKSYKFKGISFVIRCHPSENYKLYEDFQKKYRNVFFDNNFSVHPWILASEGIINHYCTTTYEAVIANKNVYTIKPDYFTDMEDDIYFEPTNIATDHQDLINLLKLKKEKKLNEVNKNCSSNLNKDHFSFSLISQQLGKLSKLNSCKSEKKSFLLKYKIIKALNHLKDKILMRKNDYVNHKIKKIEKIEIENFINLNHDYKGHIKVNKICKNFFLLTNENS